MKRSPKARILDRIASEHGCTNRVMLSLDLKLVQETVDKFVAKLIQEGMVEYAADGEGLELSHSALVERAEEARFQRLLGRSA